MTDLILIANRFMLMPSHRARFRFLSHLAYRMKAKRKERRIFISATEHLATHDFIASNSLNR